MHKESTSNEELNTDSIRKIWAASVAHDADPSASIKPSSGLVFSTSPNEVMPSQARHITNLDNDYELLRLVGKGGMGLVYLARQISLDREIAVKMLKSEKSDNDNVKQAFLYEALVTGELDHPHIVPIIELGEGKNGHLFYSMKHVKGTSWKNVIGEKTEDENLEILLTVCNAVAFAHEKGIIHRDLKPGNIMLGEYGEVMVMDWGMAIGVKEYTKAAKLTDNTASGGTPSYMPPEMAACDKGKINICSDIYLLGAILYEIITGKPPHTGDNVYKCIVNAAANDIIKTGIKSELVDIAYKAMKTEPEQRYKSVTDFQQAISEYQKHSSSISLANRAEEDLAKAKKTDDYRLYSMALIGFEEAVDLWEGNENAREKLRDVRLRYARCAYEKNDYELAESLLLAVPDHNRLLDEVRDARYQRDARKRRLIAFKWTAFALAAGLIIALTAGIWGINIEKEKALAAQEAAVEQKNIAEIARREEEKQRKKVEFELYRYGILEADRLCDAGRYQDAREVLESLYPQHRHWEWKHLMFRAQRRMFHEIMSLNEHSSSVFSLAYSLDGKYLASASFDRTVILWNADTGDKIFTLEGHNNSVDSVAISPDGQHLALGDRDSIIKVWDIARGKESLSLSEHSSWINSLAFSPDASRLVSGSMDGTIKFWNAESGEELLTLDRHASQVNSVAFSPDGRMLASGSRDATLKIWDAETGEIIFTFSGNDDTVHSLAFSPDNKRLATGSRKVTIWDAVTGKDFLTLTGHERWVTAAAFSPDGRRIVTGSRDNKVKIWNTTDNRDQ